MIIADIISTYPLPTPATYPRGEGIPRKYFFDLVIPGVTFTDMISNSSEKIKVNILGLH